MSKVRRLRSLVEALLLVGGLIVAVAVGGCDRAPIATDDRASVAAVVPIAHTSIVVAHSGNEQAPTVTDAVRRPLRAAALDRDLPGADATVVSASRPDVEVVDLEPRRPNGDVELGPRRDDLVDARLDELQRAVDRAAAAGGGGDLLAALDVARRTGAKAIVVLSAGLSTTDPLDMRLIGWDQDPEAVAADLKARGLLPDLGGTAVTFSGLGLTAGSQPALELPARAALTRQWLAVCAAAGAASCSVDDSVRPFRPPLVSTPSPVVPVPRAATTHGPGGIDTVSVPAPLLFRANSCDLVDVEAARAVVAPIADRLRLGGWTVSVSGRTAPVGPGDGVELATCRAGAAADLLRALRVPESAIGEVRGDGSLADPPGAGLGADGRPDPAALAALRRVLFTLTPKEF
ncbi:hypothetical protein [Pseudonocardia sp.]|uniref:hypothetical protein n=1 Tax=Pseudonocardia sp. TaxID=60912 RepID=UPI003D0C71B2